MDKFLRLVGIDTAALTARLSTRLEIYKDRTIEEIKSNVLNLVITIGLFAAGGLMLVLTVVVGLIALYRFVAERYGDMAGLGAVAGLFFVIGIALIFVGRAMSRKAPPDVAAAASAQRAAEREAAIAAAAAVEAREAAELAHAQRMIAEGKTQPRPASAMSFSDDQFHQPLTSVIASYFGAPAKSDRALDKMLNQVAGKVAARSEETVETAAHIMRTGPRSAFYGVLAASAVLGWMLSRQSDGK